MDPNSAPNPAVEQAVQNIENDLIGLKIMLNSVPWFKFTDPTAKLVKEALKNRLAECAELIAKVKEEA